MSALPRRLLIVAAAALVPVVAGCEAGNNAPSLQFHYPTVGAGTVVDSISIRNVFVLGAPAGVLPAGHSASLFLALVNTGAPDRLTGITAPGAATKVTVAGGAINLVTNQAVYLTGPQPKAVLTGLTRTLANGSVVTIVLHFQQAGAVALRVPVVPPINDYATFSPPPPTPTVRPHHGKAGASASPSATASPATGTSASPSASSTP